MSNACCKTEENKYKHSSSFTRFSCLFQSAPLMWEKLVWCFGILEDKKNYNLCGTRWHTFTKCDPDAVVEDFSLSALYKSTREDRNATNLFVIYNVLVLCRISRRDLRHWLHRWGALGRVQGGFRWVLLKWGINQNLNNQHFSYHVTPNLIHFSRRDAQFHCT